MDNIFRDFVNLNQYSLPSNLRNQFIDQVLESMEDQKKDKDPDQIIGLQVKSKATHAGRLTGHMHFYNPAQVRNAVDSFLNPYGKPVLRHHSEENDAIGRVVAANYIRTISPLIPQSITDRLENSERIDKKTVAAIKKLKPFLRDRKFEGLGYIQTVKNITDEDAIRKVTNGIYHTLSVGYRTNQLVCSECGQDWLGEDGKCEHTKGSDYGNGAMFLIFGDLSYSEISYVNTPADDLSQNDEVKKIIIPSIATLQDSLVSAKQADKMSIINIMMAQDSLLITNAERVPSSDVGLYLYDSHSGEFTPQSLDNIQIKKHGDTMKLKEFYSLDSKEAYSKISEFLSEDKVLGAEDLEKLEDSVFVGEGKNFPVVDEDHAEAIKKVLESFEDSDEKSELIDFINERFQSAPSEEAKVEDQDSDTSTEEVEAVELKDYINYSFKLEGENWGLPDPENPNTEAEKSILQLLLSMYAKKKEDAMEVIDSILANLEEKDDLIKEMAKDSLEEYERRIESYKREQENWKNSKDAMNKTINELSSELKDGYVERLITFQDSEDPDFDQEEVVSKLKEKSLLELKASYDSISMLFHKKDKQSNSQQIAKEEDPTAKHNETTVDSESVDTEYIDKLKKNVNSTFLAMQRKGNVNAQSFYDSQMSEIAELEKKLVKQENE